MLLKAHRFPMHYNAQAKFLQRPRVSALDSSSAEIGSGVVPLLGKRAIAATPLAENKENRVLLSGESITITHA